MATYCVTDAVGTTRLFPHMDALLDALDRGLLGGDDFAWEAERKAWVRLKEHPEVLRQWKARRRFRPLHDTRNDPLGFPSLNDDGITPSRGIAPDPEFEARRAAWRAMRGQPSTNPAADPYLSGERALTRGAVLGAIFLVLVACAALVLIASGMTVATR